MFESFASATSKISSPFALKLDKRNHFKFCSNLESPPGHLKLLQIMKLGGDKGRFTEEQTILIFNCIFFLSLTGKRGGNLG